MKTAERSIFSTWKTVEVGDLGSAETARLRLRHNEIEVSRWSDNMIGRMKFEETKTSLALVQVAVKDLGLTAGATTAAIYAAANRFGLSLCPAEVGPQLSLAHPDRPNTSEQCLVAMEAIADSAGHSGVFRLRLRAKRRWLCACPSAPYLKWNTFDCWLFTQDSHRQHNFKNQLPRHVSVPGFYQLLLVILSTSIHFHTLTGFELG